MTTHVSLAKQMMAANERDVAKAKAAIQKEAEQMNSPIPIAEGKFVEDDALDAYVEKIKVAEKKNSKALTLPSEIEDAIDGDDLIAQMKERSISGIETRNRQKALIKLAFKEEALIRAKYNQKARETYEQIWEACGSSFTGHTQISTDVNGWTIQICEVCGLPSGISASKTESSNGSRTTASEMKQTLITTLSKEMIKLDIEAEVLHWPVPDDFEGTDFKKMAAAQVAAAQIPTSTKKKKKFWKAVKAGPLG